MSLPWLTVVVFECIITVAAIGVVKLGRPMGPRSHNVYLKGSFQRAHKIITAVSMHLVIRFVR